MTEPMTHACRLEDGRLVAGRVRVARWWWERAIGLMGRRLGDGEGLLITRCRQVHTCFCVAALDLVFVDGGGRVFAVETMAPWRVGRRHEAACAVLELAAGAAGEVGPGRRLIFDPPLPGGSLDRP